MGCNETYPLIRKSAMTLFRFLRANRQAQLDWIRENPKTYITLNVVLAFVILGPSFYQDYRTEKAREKYYANLTDQQ